MLAAVFEFEILGQEDWIGRRMIADRFRDRRVFLCGDAAHIWVPFAGYGMNAGIADAMNLSWMLAGVIKGWADPELLDAYEIERQPITEQVSRYAMNVATCTWSQRRRDARRASSRPGPEGDAGATRIGRQAYEVNVGRDVLWRTQLRLLLRGFADHRLRRRGAAQAIRSMTLRQSTVPGCRTPHLWLRDGRSLYDALGSDFTLLRFDLTVDV